MVLSPARTLTEVERPAPAAADTDRASRDRWVGVSLVTVTLVVVGIGMLAGLSRFPVRSDDEGTYLAQAWAVQHLHRLSDYTYFYDHPPLGWIQIAAWTWLSHAFARVQYAVTAGREAMVIAQLASSALMYTYLRRIQVRRPFAIAAVLLFAFSPLALFYHRLVYLDNVAVAWVLASVVLAASPRRHLAAYAGSGACFAVALLTKETSFLFLPVVVTQLWMGAAKPNRRFAVALFGVTMAVLVAGYPLYAVLKGELIPGPGHVSLVEGIKFQLLNRKGSGHIFQVGSDAYNRAKGWLTLDPWLVAAGTAGSVVCVTRRRLRPIGIGMLTLVLMTLRPGYLPFPYIISVLALAPMAAVAPLDELWQWARGKPVAKLAVPALALAVTSALVLVVPRWQRFFVEASHQDANVHEAAATDWLTKNLPPHARLLSPDPIRIDLILAGRDPAEVVWINKIDSDPAVQRGYPHGWRDFDYLVASSDVRGYVNTGEIPEVAQALTNSTVVVSFGGGGDRVEIRIVRSVGPPSDERHLGEPAPQG